jgi:uncharacterized protein
LLLTNSRQSGQVGEIRDILKSRIAVVPSPRQGRFDPWFLGLLPTRGCNLACGYCGFLTGQEADQVMDLALVREAVAWYLGLVSQSGARTAEVHFFGGEPFCAEEVVDFAYHFARLKAVEVGCTVRFEVATNGTFGEDRCRWVADSLHNVILSLDGPAAVQNRHRPYLGGQGSFEAVARSARILSEGTTELSFRVCVTTETVDQLPEIAGWLCQEYRPLSICFEPVQPTLQSETAGLLPPDPWDFARGFIQAARVLKAHGVEPIYAAADIRTRRVTFCPVGRDVPIVSPDGVISACYLLRRDWESKGLDLRLGRIDNGSVVLDRERVAAARSLNVHNKPLCTGCFCKWHCAGGCHVNHVLLDTPGAYDRLCIQTRIITLSNILKAMARDDLVAELLADAEALERVVWQVSDAMADVGGNCE